MAIFHYLQHLDSHLLLLSQEYGYAAYIILFLIIFSETGLVIAPFLPGDTLLFVAGAVAALDTTGHAVFNLPMLIVTLTLAAFFGNLLNFQIGRWLGPKVFHWEKSRLFNPRHLAEAHAFYERHGGKTVVISRFLPILRTYAPFVAGVGDMSHSRFMAFNALGAFMWVVSLLMAGYFFGNVPFIKNNLSLMIAGIVAITLMPLVVAGIWARFKKRT
ncbi:MAG: VTT domain-containing protein [Betaproteobacteria bacterium]|nr:VTT domain-containing protein [Betaproteobacteria bacterium]